MTRALALILSAASLALAAETTTISMYFIGDRRPLEASISGVDSHGLTSMHLNCPSSLDSDDCGLPPNGVQVTQGPSSWGWTLSSSDSEIGAVSQVINCDLDSAKNQASCFISQGQSLSGAVTSASNLDVETDLSGAIIPVTVTAGAEKLSAGAAVSTTGASATETGASTGATGSGSVAATSSKTGAAPAKTQHAVVAVVAVVGAIAL